MNKQSVLVDYGCGNLFSIQKRMAGLGADFQVSADPEVVGSADRLILPGVGHFATAMRNLEQRGLVPALHRCALERKIPILGICLGFQLMAAHSQEGDCAGLGWFEAEVVALPRPTTHSAYKVPHTGWSQVRQVAPGRLWKNLENPSEFYFIHSYCWQSRGSGEEVVGATEYGPTFPTAVERGHLYGVQFHPEKSHDSGETLLHNFLTASDA